MLSTGLLQGLCDSSTLPFASSSSSCWSMISLWCGGMRRGSCLMGSCSPVLISCFKRSHYPKSQLLIADMPSYWSIIRENCLFCSSEGPSELGWITFALLFSLSVLSCLSSPIFLSITEQYKWLGAHGLAPISVGVALPLTPLTVWYSATGRSDRKVTTLTEKLATRTRVCPALGTSRERGIPMLEVPCTSYYPSRIVGLWNSVRNLHLI